MAPKRAKPAGRRSTHKMPCKQANTIGTRSSAPDSQFVSSDNAKRYTKLSKSPVQERGPDLPIEELLEFYNFIKEKKWEKLCKPPQSGVAPRSSRPCSSSSKKIGNMVKQKIPTPSRHTSRSRRLQNTEQQGAEEQEQEQGQERTNPQWHSPRVELRDSIPAPTVFCGQSSQELELEDPWQLVVKVARAESMAYPLGEQAKNIESRSDSGAEPMAHPSGEGAENIDFSSSEFQSRRQTRGKAKNKGAMTMIKKSKGCIPVEIKDGSCVGPNAKYVPREIGIRVREHFPIAKRGFKEVDKDKLIELIAYLKGKFEFGSATSEEVEEYVKRTADATYRCFRTKCAKHYQKVVEQGQDPKTCPIKNWMQSNDDWKQLCEYFGSEEFQKRSKTRMENRSKVRYVHKCGSQSFANRREQMDLNLIEGFKECYTDQQGRWVSELHKEYYNRMKEREVEVIGSASSINHQEILVDVLGQKSGYCRGVGGGLKPTKKMRIGSGSAYSTAIVTEENRLLREEIEDLKKKMNEITIAHQAMFNIMCANFKGPLPIELQRFTNSLQFTGVGASGDGDDAGGDLDSDEDGDDDGDEDDNEFQP